MRITQTLDTRQTQTQRIDPRQILASEILAWSNEELEAAVERELAENPALDRKDGEAPRRDAEPVSSAESGANPAEKTAADRLLEARERKNDTAPVVPGSALDDLDPFDRVAHGLSLREHLRRQVGQAVAAHPDAHPELLRYLIECVDDRGYLGIEIDELTERFRIGRQSIESSIAALHTMDPPGIGARSLQESLRLQAEYLEANGEGNPLASRILTQCWDELATNRIERIAGRLRCSKDAADEAVAFLRRALTPYPGSSFRPEGARAVDAAPPVRPDVLFHRTEAGFVVELARDYNQVLEIAELWKDLASGAEPIDDSMKRYVRDHVDRAQAFLNGVSRRGRTLRSIARELARHQVGFLETRNRAFLRPLTRQTLATTLGLDESVISRAVADKWAQLPTGEVVPLDAFFGNSQAVREALLQLIQEEDPRAPLSDDDLADRLTEMGFPLARRTVAKYRGIERILPARMRKRRAA
ncbi:MAG: RNA polymerase sigma-54 factor [Armatimonadota bacterium]